MTQVVFDWRGEVSRTLLVGSRSSGTVGQRGRGQASFAQHLRSGIVKGLEVQHLTLVRLPGFSLPRDLVPDLVERVGALSEDHVASAHLVMCARICTGVISTVAAYGCPIHLAHCVPTGIPNDDGAPT
jgi:hypothetical protein